MKCTSTNHNKAQMNAQFLGVLWGTVVNIMIVVSYVLWFSDSRLCILRANINSFVCCVFSFLDFKIDVYFAATTNWSIFNAGHYLFMLLSNFLTLVASLSDGRTLGDFWNKCCAWEYNANISWTMGLLWRDSKCCWSQHYNFSQL